MRIAWALFLVPLLSVTGCKGEAPSPPAASGPLRPDAPGAAEVAAVRGQLEGAGIAVQRVETLSKDGYCREEWSYRLYFGLREFLNQTRYPDAPAARACLEEYRRQVAKGGPAAIDRLMPLLHLEGPYLLQLSETVMDPKRRDAIFAAARAGLAEPAGQ